MRNSGLRRLGALLAAAIAVSAVAWVLLEKGGDSSEDVRAAPASARAEADGAARVFSAPTAPPGGRAPEPVPSPQSLEQDGLTVRGVIVDDLGVPIRGAEVKLVDVARQADRLPAASTDERGAFQLVAPRAGTFDLAARAAGHMLGVAPGLLLAPDVAAPSRSLTLVRRGGISAAFFDRLGAAVSDAALAAVRRLPADESGLPGTAAFADARLTDPRRIQVAPPDDLGRCVLADVDPGAYSVWRSEGRHDLLLATEWRKQLPRADGPELFATVEVRPGETAAVSFRVPDPASIGGVVTDGGVVAPHALLALFDNDLLRADADDDEAQHASLLLARTTTDDEGRYEFAALMPGSYAVYALVSGLCTPAVAFLDVKEGQRLVQDIPIEGVTVHGLVVDGQTREPLSDMLVCFDFGRFHVPQFQSTFPAVWGRDLETICPGFLLGAKSDAEGRFSVRCLRLSSHDLTFHWFEVSGSGYAPSECQIAIEPDAAREMSVTVGMDPGAIIDGTLAAGAAVPDLAVRLEGPWAPNGQPESTVWIELKVGSAPHIHFASLERGQYTITVFDTAGTAHGTLDVGVATGEHAVVVVPTDL